jgi:hypothetical protein
MKNQTYKTQLRHSPKCDMGFSGSEKEFKSYFRYCSSTNIEQKNVFTQLTKRANMANTYT